MLGSRRAHLEGPSGRQVVDIRVADGYQPATIVARAGVPLRLVFERDDDDVCSERVIFSRPRLERRLLPKGSTIVDLPAQPAGQVHFTCGMGRYRGVIALEEEHSGVLATIRWHARQRTPALATAGIVWLCVLPLIAIVGLLAFGITTTLVAAASALLVLVATCLWAFGRSAPTSASRTAGQAQDLADTRQGSAQDGGSGATSVPRDLRHTR